MFRLKGAEESLLSPQNLQKLAGIDWDLDSGRRLLGQIHEGTSVSNESGADDLAQLPAEAVGLAVEFDQ